jgi:protein-S-isoprenylcysteine O-methyltransferase Ste14
MVTLASAAQSRTLWALLYAWSGVVIMWAFWVSFLVFLAEPRQFMPWWPLPTIDQEEALLHPLVAAVIDLGLIALFGLQHSVMARPWFKKHVMHMPYAFERCTLPLPQEVWNVGSGLLRDVMWMLFAAGFVILFLGAWSYGIRDLLGIEQMRAWVLGRAAPQPRLKTGRLYRWLRHPMYVGVLMGVWMTPRMSVGHLLLAFGLTGYVLIAMRYEERDLARAFGTRYRRWRQAIPYGRDPRPNNPITHS